MTRTDDAIDNITYQQLTIGQTARLTRTLSGDDILAFAAVSGDDNPAHVDADYADHTLFHGVIAHGMWGAALISRLLGTVMPGPGTVYLAQTLQFRKPVRIGDELRVTARVSAKDDLTHHVELDCEIKNQTGAVVLSGVATVLAPTEPVHRPRASLPQLTLTRPHAPYAALLANAAALTPARCAVIHPCDLVALSSTLDATRRGLIIPLLLGPQQRLQALAAGAGLALDGVTLIDVPHSHAAAARGATMAAAGEVDLILQGSLQTEELMEAVRATPGLHTDRAMSHVFRVEVPLYEQVLLISDGVLNLQPTLEDKADIVQNAIDLAHALGTAEPRVALLAAQAEVSAAMPSTLDAAALCKMAVRGQLHGALLDGPLAFDHALVPAAARAAGIVSPVAGHADILIAPDLEAGSLLVKQFECLAGAAVCGVLAGARVPIALASAAPRAGARIASIAMARLLAHTVALPSATPAAVDVYPS